MNDKTNAELGIEWYSRVIKEPQVPNHSGDYEKTASTFYLFVSNLLGVKKDKEFVWSADK